MECLFKDVPIWKTFVYYSPVFQNEFIYTKIKPFIDANGILVNVYCIDYSNRVLIFQWPYPELPLNVVS